MLELLAQPLLADIGEVLGALLGLVALVFWVIQQIAGANKEGGQQRRQANAPRQAQPAAAPGGAPGGGRRAGQQADPLRNQVEEFLRRAGRGQEGDRGGPQPRRGRPAAQEIEVLIDEASSPGDRPAHRGSSSAGERAADAARAGTPAAPVPPVPEERRPARRPVVGPKRKTLAERAAELAAARARELEKKFAHLGQRIIEEDEQFDEQLKAKFDHALGTLASPAAPIEAPPPNETPAGQIAAMLSNPDGVRQAIVLNEVLRRPTDRW